jgi:hypothetical protein
MTKATTLINNFSAGELSPTVDVRSDTEKYYSGCKTMENFMPLPEGGATRVPGTYFVQEVSDSTKKTRVVPFIFNSDQAFMLEFGEKYIRFFKDEAQIATDTILDFDPSAAYTQTTDYCKRGGLCTLNCGSGKYLHITMPHGQNLTTIPTSVSVYTSTADALSVTCSGPVTYTPTFKYGYYIKIYLAKTTKSKNAANLIQAAIRAKGTMAGVDVTAWCVTENSTYAADRDSVDVTQTFSTSSCGYYQCSQNISSSAYNTSQIPYSTSAYWDLLTTIPTTEVTTTYLEADLFNLKFLQSGDIIYIFHPSYPSKKLTRDSNLAWTFTDLLTSIGGEMTITAISRANPAVMTVTPPAITSEDSTYMTVTGATQANPCVVTVSTPSAIDFPTDGDVICFADVAGMTELNGNSFEVTLANESAGTFALLNCNSGAYGAYTSGGKAFKSSFVWPVATDILYVSAGDMVEITDGFYTAGTCTVTHSNGILYETIGLTGINSTAYTPYTTGGTVQRQKYGTSGNYPSCGTFFEQRLMLAGSDNNPFTVNGSVSGDYENFTQTYGEDDSAIEYSMVSDRVERVLWMEGRESLFIGTYSGIWKSGASDTRSPMTATDVKFDKIMNNPSKDIEPEIANETIIFIAKSGLKVNKITYDYYTDSWPPYDLTRIAKHITQGDTKAESGIVDMDLQNSPSTTLWAVRADGTMICLLYDTQDNVFSWYRIVTDGYFESVAVITTEDEEDQVWVVVKRTIDGEDVRYIEFFKPVNFFHQIEDAFFVHSGLTWDGGTTFDITGITQANPAVVTCTGHLFEDGDMVSIVDVEGMTEVNCDSTEAYEVDNAVAGVSFELKSTDSSAWTAYSSGGTAQKVHKDLSGLDHLEGEDVAVVVDGAVHTEETVTSGAISLDYYGNKIHVGLPCEAILEPMPLSHPQVIVRGQKQRINKLTISFYETFGGEYGVDEDNLFDIPFGTGGSPDLFTGDVDAEFERSWDTQATIVIKQSDPSPMTVLGIIPRLNVNQEG